MPSLPQLSPLTKLRSIADYQFGPGAGTALFPRDIKVTFSPRTKRIRHIYDKQLRLLATHRPTDGFLVLSPIGGQRLKKAFHPPQFRVVVKSDVADFIAQGRSVFAKHVVEADEAIRPYAEVIVVDEKDRLLALGKAILTGKEMKVFKVGVAVKVRRGVKQNHV